MKKLLLTLSLPLLLLIVGCSGSDPIIYNVDAPTSAKVNDNVKFTATTEGDGLIYYWYIDAKNDGSSSSWIDTTTTNTMTTKFDNTGNHWVVLFIVDENNTMSAPVKSSIVNISSTPIDTGGGYTGSYPWHKSIIASTFWCGEDASDANDFITNTESAWNGNWGDDFGVEDKPLLDRDSDFIPNTFSGYKGTENPYYFALPYDDIGSLVYDGEGTEINNAQVDRNDRKISASNSYWYKDKTWGNDESIVKNRWVHIKNNGKSVYAQWEDAGPYYYNDYNYVFGSSTPANMQDISKNEPNAGIDLSPSVCRYLNKYLEDWGAEAFNVDWAFIDESDVPDGPWKKHITTSQIDW